MKFHIWWWQAVYGRIARVEADVTKAWMTSQCCCDKNRFIDDAIFLSGTGAAYMRYSIGPSTERCWTQQLSLWLWEESLSICTNSSSFWSEPRERFSFYSKTIHKWLSNMMLSTLSKAAERSSNNRTTYLPSWIRHRRSLWTLANDVSVPWACLNADWYKSWMQPLSQ